MIKWIANRLREPSTYAGIAALSAILGIDEEYVQAIVAICGGIAVFMPEGK